LFSPQEGNPADTDRSGPSTIDLPPSTLSLAAFTIASAASLVMSPTTTASLDRIRPRGAPRIQAAQPQYTVKKL
jgi:hypothetical protein